MKSVAPIAALSWVFVACLGTPEKANPRPYPTSGECGEPGQLPLDVTCWKSCTDSRTCPGEQWCTYIEGYASVCTDYSHCAYLASDTECTVTEAGGMTMCAGNAKWQVDALVGDPACGRWHEVFRCQLVEDRCELVKDNTYDMGSP